MPQAHVGKKMILSLIIHRNIRHFILTRKIENPRSCQTHYLNFTHTLHELLIHLNSFNSTTTHYISRSKFKRDELCHRSYIAMLHGSLLKITQCQIICAITDVYQKNCGCRSLTDWKVRGNVALQRHQRLSGRGQRILPMATRGTKWHERWQSTLFQYCGLSYDPSDHYDDPPPPQFKPKNYGKPTKTLIINLLYISLTYFCFDQNMM